MLSVTNVVAGYGAHDEVLKGVGITVAGAACRADRPERRGKSTLLKSIAGFLPRRARSPSRAGRSADEAARDHPPGHRLRGSQRVPRSASGEPRIGSYVTAAPQTRMQAAFARFPCSPSAATRRRARSGRTAPDARDGDGADGAPRLMLDEFAGLARSRTKLFADQGLHDEGMTVIMSAERTHALELQTAYRCRRLERARARRLGRGREVRHAFLGG
jgi:hypothetical protein